MVYMMDSGSTIKDMDMENIHGLSVIKKAMSMKVIGALIKRMVKAQRLGLMAVSMSVNGIIIL